MIYSFIRSALFLALLHGTAQGQSQSMNLVIVIDEELRSGSLMNMELSNPQQRGDAISVGYVPGELTVQSLSSIEGDSLYLSFDYYSNDDRKGGARRFVVPFPRKYFEWEYVVLRLYDLRKRKYRKQFEPYKPGAEFTFEIDYPGGQVLRIRKN